jgi:hypothetical protein
MLFGREGRSEVATRRSISYRLLTSLHAQILSCRINHLSSHLTHPFYTSVIDSGKQPVARARFRVADHPPEPVAEQGRR